MGILHVADESGKGCRYCPARWYNDDRGRGLTVPPGIRVDHEGRGAGSVPTHDTWHPLAVTAGSEAEPCSDIAYSKDWATLLGDES